MNLRTTIVRVGLPVAASIAFAMLHVGCAVVKPWERGRLSNRCMAVVPDPEESKTEQHLFSYREGSAGGYGDSGGGCGCN